MPTYEYRCNACGHEFEQFQSITADAIKVCPKCKKKTVQRLLSGGAGLIFKGSGFYITDYRSDSYKNAAKAESGGGEKKSDGGSKSEPAKTDSKPAAAAKSEPAPAPKSAPKPPSKDK